METRDAFLQRVLKKGVVWKWTTFLTVSDGKYHSKFLPLLPPGSLGVCQWHSAKVQFYKVIR